jgi:hypothetical protein
VTIGATEARQTQQPSPEPVCPIARGGTSEPGVLSMIAAALVLLIAVSAVIWTSSSVPNGRSVVVTVRNP